METSSLCTAELGRRDTTDLTPLHKRKMRSLMPPTSQTSLRKSFYNTTEFLILSVGTYAVCSLRFILGHISTAPLSSCANLLFPPWHIPHLSSRNSNDEKQQEPLPAGLASVSAVPDVGSGQREASRTCRTEARYGSQLHW